LKKYSQTLTVIVALSVIIMWGFSFIAIEIALREVTPSQLVTLRFVPTFIIFASIGLYRLTKHKISINKKDFGRLLLSGFFAVIVYNYSLNTGQTYLPASFAALVIALNPASIAIIANAWIGEKPDGRTWLGLLLGLIGISVVILGRQGTPELQMTYLIGALITLAAPLSWGIFTSGLRIESRRIGSLTATIISISLGSFPMLFTINKSLITTTVNGSSSLWLSVIFLSLGCTVYGFTAWAWVLKRMEAVKAGTFIYLVPLIAAIGSTWLLGEIIDLPFILGGLMVILGVTSATGHLDYKKLFRRTK